MKDVKRKKRNGALISHVLWAILLVLVCPVPSQAQTLVSLNADGPGNTYELINGVLAPGYNAVENPECAHPAFGRHIAEVFDATLNKYVFEFYSHVVEDNDRCINFDRQRVEIKTYDQSPANLIGTVGETVTYKWQFRLPVGFQPSSSFTHIHQVKAVGGDESDPIFTLTVRKGTPNKLELIHDNTTKVAIVNLSLFAGVWVEATETLSIGPNGTYDMQIKRVSDGVTVLSYTSSNIRTIRPTNDFIRPKWGIYRSLNSPADLRDDSIRLGTISIAENNVVVPLQLTSFTAAQGAGMVTLDWKTATEINLENFTIERSADGRQFSPLHVLAAAGNSSSTQKYLYVDKAPLTGKNYYRLKQTSKDGSINYSTVIFIDVSIKDGNLLRIFPNPVTNRLDVLLPFQSINLQAVIVDSRGVQCVAVTATSNNISEALTNNLPGLKSGWYTLQINDGKRIYKSTFIKQ